MKTKPGCNFPWWWWALIFFIFGTWLVILAMLAYKAKG